MRLNVLIVVGMMIFFSFSVVAFSETVCHDNIDNDQNGKIDCADENCWDGAKNDCSISCKSEAVLSFPEKNCLFDKDCSSSSFCGNYYKCMIIKIGNGCDCTITSGSSAHNPVSSCPSGFSCIPKSKFFPSLGNVCSGSCSSSDDCPSGMMCYKDKCIPETEICDNGLDDDGDKAVDCQDNDCLGYIGRNGVNRDVLCVEKDYHVCGGPKDLLFGKSDSFGKIYSISDHDFLCYPNALFNIWAECATDNNVIHTGEHGETKKTNDVAGSYICLNNKWKLSNTDVSVKPDTNSVGIVKLDIDSDGIADTQDKCPNTPARIKVGSEGCPDFDNDQKMGFGDVTNIKKEPSLFWLAMGKDLKNVNNYLKIFRDSTKVSFQDSLVQFFKSVEASDQRRSSAASSDATSSNTVTRTVTSSPAAVSTIVERTSSPVVTAPTTAPATVTRTAPSSSVTEPISNTITRTSISSDASVPSAAVAPRTTVT